MRNGNQEYASSDGFVDSLQFLKDNPSKDLELKPKLSSADPSTPSAFICIESEAIHIWLLQV